MYTDKLLITSITNCAEDALLIIDEELTNLILLEVKKSCQSDELDLPDGGIIELSFVSKEDIRKLNFDYRNKDYPTDVLSFRYNETDHESLGLEEIIFPKIVGELIISPAIVLAQSSDFGNTPETELIRVIVHGFLHLFGFDHENVPEPIKERMFFLEDQNVELLCSHFKAQLQLTIKEVNDDNSL